MRRAADHILSAAGTSKLGCCTDMKFKEYFKGMPPKDLHEALTAFDE